MRFALLFSDGRERQLQGGHIATGKFYLATAVGAKTASIFGRASRRGRDETGSLPSLVFI
jgi:hypothetical protein